MDYVLHQITRRSLWWWYLTAGICLGLGFLWPFFWWLVVPGVALYIYAVSRTETLFRAFFGGWLAFTIKMFFSIGWFFTTYPIIWIDLSLGAAELPVIGFYWLTVALAIGLSGGVLAGSVWYFAKNVTAAVWWGMSVLLWVPAEVLGSLFFSIFTYGVGGTINVMFSFGYAGYLLALHPWLLLAAEIFGVYGLSFIAAGFGLALMALLSVRRTFQQYMWLAGLCVVLLVTVYIPVPHTETVKTTTVAIIDTQFGGEGYFSMPEKEAYRVTQIEEALTAALATKAAYVVMPEDSRFLSGALSPRSAYEQFVTLHDSTDTVVIDAGRVPTAPKETALRSTVYDGIAKTGHAVDKQYLVPQGEFMPNFYLWILERVGLSAVAERIRTQLSYRPGPRASQAELPSHVPAVLFCFANADPLALRKFVSQRTFPFVAHPISHAWFHEPESLWRQFDLMLRVQAVWNDMEIVSAGNMVAGALYSPSGEKIAPEIVASGESWQVGIVSW
jgi:apolipoprotein N-acyltransferase